MRCKGENELISSIRVDGGQNNYYVSFKRRIIEKRLSGVSSGNKQATLSSSQSLNNVTFVSDRNTIYLSFDGRNFDTKREYQLTSGIYTIYARCAGENEIVGSVEVKKGNNVFKVSFNKRTIR